MFTKRKSLLLGILAAATATGLALGVNGVVDAYVGEPVEVSAESDTFTDRITADNITATDTNYKDFTYQSSNGVVYFGSTAKDKNSIQIRSKNNNSLRFRNLYWL